MVDEIVEKLQAEWEPIEFLVTELHMMQRDAGKKMMKTHTTISLFSN